MALAQDAAPLVVLAMGTDRHVAKICAIDGSNGHERWRFQMELGKGVHRDALAEPELR